MQTYTYDPARILDQPLYRMRFELGDTAVDGGGETCPLCDEEYQAVLTRMEEEGKPFLWAKVVCLKAILAKLAYEADYSIDGLSMKLSARYGHWVELYEQVSKEALASGMAAALRGAANQGGHYFQLGMQENPAAGYRGGGWDSGKTGGGRG